MSLGVVVLNWNGIEVTPRCLDSIVSSSCPPDRIVVVDNASTDGSAELVRSRYPHVDVIVNDSNLGFAEGCNVGLRHLLDHGCDLILLLNNDAILDSEALCAFRHAAQEHPAAAYGAAIFELTAPQSLWYGGGSVSRLTLDARHLTAAEDALGASRPTGFVTGCCLLFRADALREIGLLDPDFFAYYEDVDWCLRAGAAGHRLIYVPAAMVQHEVSHTFRKLGDAESGKSSGNWSRPQPLVLYLAYRNRLLLARKHARGSLHLSFLILRRLWRAVLHGGMLALAGRGAQARAVAEGTMAGLRRPPEPVQVERYISMHPSHAARR